MINREWISQNAKNPRAASLPRLRRILQQRRRRVGRWGSQRTSWSKQFVSAETSASNAVAESIRLQEQARWVRYDIMSLRLTLLGIAASLSFSACGTSLSQGGQQVNYSTKQEPPSDCEMIDSVYHEGTFECEATVSSLQNALRNKTADLGGNFLVIDTIVTINTKDGSCFKGAGRAFTCPASRATQDR